MGRLGGRTLKIFISWSGNAAHEMAKFLEVWLVKVIQALEPFVSSSIESGARWDAEIASQLEEIVEGIVIVTSRNQHEPWLNFEAGALAKATDVSRVRPLLIDLTPTDVKGPISSFQATHASQKESVFKMLKEINARCERRLDEGILQQTFGREWNDFKTKLDAVIELEKTSNEERPPGRGTPEIVAEILERVRAIEREGLDQRLQFSTFASELRLMRTPVRYLMSDAEHHESEVRRRAWSNEQRRLYQAEQEAEVAARRLKGTTVRAEAPSVSGGISGVVRDTLTRGTGVYVRIDTSAGDTHVVPLNSIVGIED
ncbi:hypothetical protein BST18_22700 [Mycobacteroides abscessus subsp. bolletii]|nr:hypothetical protein BST18_22700 [Mycobacteroides abscessus subsp. bolletii]